MTQPTTLPADEVIEKFGGLRPLASRLGIAASTVQGWKERGVIPESRVSEIMEAAAQDGIVLHIRPPQEDDTKKDAKDSQGAMTSPLGDKQTPAQKNAGAAQKPEALKPDMPATAATASTPVSRFTADVPASDVQQEDRREYTDRRSAGDRRQRQDPDFKGPDRRIGDRRSGLDRRQQRAAEWVHKKRFLERWLLTVSVLFGVIVLVGVFLLAPEYKELQDRAARYDAMEQQLENMNRQIETMSEDRTSLSGKINEGLSMLERTKQEVTRQVKTAEQLAAELSQGNWQDRVNLAERKILGFSTMMDRLDSLMTTPGGQQALDNSLRLFKEALSSGTAQTPEQLNQMRRNDPILATLTKDVSGEDLQAAMMLLTLNQIRDSMGKDAASFDADLALLQNLNKDDPGMQAAIARLAPYAESGVLSQERLSAEFKGLAGEIVMAKLRGEDASVQDRAMARLSELMTIRRIDDLTGETPDAIVARAQLKIEQNDIRGAIAELQKLEGAPADVASPWIAQANARVAAESASQDLAQNILQTMMNENNFSPRAIEGLVRKLFGQGGVSKAVVSGGNPVPTSAGMSYPQGGQAYPGLAK